MVDSNTRQAKRTPVTLKVKFKSETLDQFIERYAVDVSQGGIFIRTKEPQPVGTQMKFEFQLRDGAPLIGGEGTVVWIREPDPARPAVAPGMGVRFDRLAEGSPVVLERILNQKSRQSGGGLRGVPSKTPSFNETPTRVAQMPMTDDEREHTPLPSPMPFHSDADEFPDEAFEEATKVRSVEDLIAQTAMSTADLPLPAPPVSSPGIAPPPFQAPAGTPPFASQVPARDQEPTRTLLDVSPPPPQVASRTLIDAAPAPAGRTLLDAVPPPPPVQASSPALVPPPVVSSPGFALPPIAPLAEPRGRALEPASELRSRTATGAPPPQVATAPAAPIIGRTMQPRESKTALLVIAVVCTLAAIAAVVWLVWLRKPGAINEPGTKPAPVAPVATAPAEIKPQTPPPPPPPAADLVETTIEVNAANAAIEVLDADQRGPSPLVAKLEKGKTYKAKVTAAGHIASEITVIGGNDPKVAVKLEPKPRVLEVNSTPGQASIYIDGVSTRRTTPASVDLSAAQAGRKLRLMIRRVGYQPFFVTIKPEDFGEQTDRMLHTVNASLTSARAAPPRLPDDPPKDGDPSGTPAPEPSEPKPEPEAKEPPPAPAPEPTPAPQ